MIDSTKTSSNKKDTGQEIAHKTGDSLPGTSLATESSMALNYESLLGDEQATGSRELAASHDELIIMRDCKPLEVNERYIPACSCHESRREECHQHGLFSSQAKKLTFSSVTAPQPQ